MQINRRTLLISSLAAAALAGCSNSSSQDAGTSASSGDASATGSTPTSATANDSASATGGTSATDSAGSTSAAGGAPVTITVTGWDPGASKEVVALVKKNVADFQKMYPNITVQPKEFVWKADTFGPQLAAGTVPNVFWTPFTEAQALISRGPVAHHTQAISHEPWYPKINKNLWQVGQKDGKTYGCPFSGYGMALHINRDLFTKAGLDPDTNFATWDEFRQGAKAIHDKTGKQGFGIMAVKNQGGWELTTLAYAMGGRAETVTGTKAEATLTNDAFQKALGLLKEMRWTDDSLGANALYEATPLTADFQAGKIGMIMHVAGIWHPKYMLATSDQDYGLLGLPMEGDDPALLGGGNCAFVSPKTTPEQQAAAAKWIAFNYYNGQLDQKTAVDGAKAAKAANQSVGLPQMPVFDQATLDQYNEWIKPYINAPVQNFTPYLDSFGKVKLAAEPAVMAQDLYAALDDAVQGIQTDKNASVDSLLQDAQDTISSKLG